MWSGTAGAGCKPSKSKTAASRPRRSWRTIRGYELSADGKKILVLKDNEIYVIDAAAAAPPALAEKRLDLSRWTFSLDPREEWRQMFVDAWRMERDYFYDRNLHNVDYQGLSSATGPSSSG